MPTNTIIAIATYSKKEYADLLILSEDADKMDETWEEWTVGKNEAVKNLKKMGLQVKEVMVKLPDLVLFCREKGLAINGDSRAMFARELGEKE